MNNDSPPVGENGYLQACYAGRKAKTTKLLTGTDSALAGHGKMSLELLWSLFMTNKPFAFY